MPDISTMLLLSQMARWQWDFAEHILQTLVFSVLRSSPGVYNFISFYSTDLHSLTCINHNFLMNQPVISIYHLECFSLRLFLDGYTLHLSSTILFGIQFTRIQIQLKFFSSTKKRNLPRKMNICKFLKPVC